MDVSFIPAVGCLERGFGTGVDVVLLRFMLFSWLLSDAELSFVP